MTASRFRSIYRRYERLNFSLGLQNLGEKSGHGHKPGDSRYIRLSADRAAQLVADAKDNVSICPCAPFAFLDVDWENPWQVERALGVGVQQHRTARKRKHFLVSLATRRIEIRNEAVETPHGKIDVKGCNKGYVIGPGSRTADGIYTGRNGSIPVFDDAMLDRLLKMTGGEVAKRAESFPEREAIRHKPNDEHVKIAMSALAARLVGEYPAGSGTYKQWTAMTWSLKAFAGEPLKFPWANYSVSTRRIKRTTSATFEQTWRNAPINSHPGYFCKIVNAQSRLRGIPSPIPIFTDLSIGTGWPVELAAEV